eukprot:10122335-Prorocentrum_lima.AAC.1
MASSKVAPPRLPCLLYFTPFYLQSSGSSHHAWPRSLLSSLFILPSSPQITTRLFAPFTHIW